MSDSADVLTLARAHLRTFAAHQGNRPNDARGAPWPVAIESARLLGLATREIEELRAQVRRLGTVNAALLAAIEARRRPARPARGAAGPELELVLASTESPP